MGLKFSKAGVGKPGNAVGHHNSHFHLLSYLTRTFYLHHLVSKKRRRMLVGGYDLDMTYITDRILAMSFPAERMRAMYRNPLWQVKSVLDMRHPGHYKVYNLCVEESYDPSHFHGRVEVFPFDDNHVPPLEMLKLFCESVRLWLSVDPANIAVIHCMAGKGRTGLMVCAYLVYLGMSAEEALQMYAQRRTINNEGVSIPSQRRYVGYWSKILTCPSKVDNGPPYVNLPQPCSRELRRIRLYDTINTNAVFFVVSELQKVPGQMYQPCVEVARSCCREIKKGYHRTSSPRYYISFIESEEDEKKLETETPRVVVQMDTESSAIYQKTCLDYYFEKPLRVTGDVRVIFYQKMVGGRLFYACFNTAFITNCLQQFSLNDLDKVGFNGKSICGPSFCLELLFGPTNGKNLISSSCDDDVLSDDLSV
ncbi:hypothetical protein AQUCO_02600120v1 [Aquilegia coerulea]|uniref:Phosphatidylinositol-3,4,5-trisphosphate 3-phosphatase n=1 Tax=Aquilegia coerulea TaxID=218851 RepID=A0A2G5D7F4_AQUCA|nr:hypothetical protein AQUCO_02600120v1 [Aquilegia coerulea]